MPGLVAPLVAFALGVLFALEARSEIQRYDDLERAAALRIVALFGAFVCAPVTAYFVAFAGDWSLAYLAEARGVPSALGLVWVVATACAAPLGFEAGRRAVRRHAQSELVLLAAVPAAMVLVFVVALYPELRLEGTTREVRGGFGTHPVAGSSLGWAILWMDAMLAAGTVLTIRALSPKKRRSSDPNTKTAIESISSVGEPPVSQAPPSETGDREPTRLLGQRRRRRID